MPIRLIAALLLFMPFSVFPLVAAGQDTNTGPLITRQGETSSAAPSLSRPASFDQLINTIVQRERFFVAQMRHFQPLVETYIQNLKGSEEKAVPVSDRYFLGRLHIANGADDVLFRQRSGFRSAFHSKLSDLFGMNFLPLGFAQMVLLDTDFQAANYDFTFVSREFLGEVRCLVIDVRPKQQSTSGRFVGRIWAEDKDYNIVRFNGTYNSGPRRHPYLHFDTWRLNLRPGVWLPAYIYSEESNAVSSEGHRFHFKAQTRLWGYDLQRFGSKEEFTQIIVEAPQGVQDQSDTGQDASPVASERQWEHQAEDNTLERLQTAGLLAPAGDVDKVLLTVINNLIVTNNLNIQPEVRARVLLTTPLESFTVGHTIVVSRGLLDVLPDEPSLAMVLAHELAHIALGHRLDTQFAFSDRMFFSDEDTFERLDLKRSPADEEAADGKAMEMLAKSPYKDKLGNAGLFLEQLRLEAPVLKNLIRPHFGTRLTTGAVTRMSALLNSAPQVEQNKIDQIAALPLGARIKTDPWSDRIELLKVTSPPLVSPREKMPFEVTAFFPFLKRFNDKEGSAATAASRQQLKQK